MSANIKATNTEAIIGVGGVDQMTVSNAGVVTANSFVGNVTGNITGNITGNASSATALATGSTTARTLANRFADYYYIADFATGDLAARAAFDARVPLNVLSGESAKIVCNPTTGDDFKAMCLWFARCNKAEDATFYIELANGGHEISATNGYVRLFNTNIAVDLRASGGPVEIQVTSINYAPVTGFTYRATVGVALPLPASVEVNSPIGMQNIQGDNDALTANGGQIVETIAGDRLSFTFIFYSPKGAPVTPTTITNTPINGITPNRVICPRAWLRLNPIWPGGSVEGFINLYTGSRMTIREIGFSYNGVGQGPTSPDLVDERDILFAKDNGSFFELYDKVVIAGAGDKNIRLDSGGGAYINRSCIGGAAKGSRWLDLSCNSYMRVVRCSFGGAKGNAVTVADGCTMVMSQSVLGGGVVGIQTVGAGASFAYDINQASNFTYGMYPVEGVISIDDDANSKIERCTTGIRKVDIDSQVIGTPVYGTGTYANTNDLDTLASTDATSFYRHGTWTPILSDVTATFSLQNGNYVIIGNIVHCRVRLFATSLDNADISPVKISGLPFAVDAGTTYLSANISVSPKNSTLLKTATSDVYINGYFSSGSIILSKGASDMLYTDMNSSGYLYMSIIYHSAI